MFRVLNRGCPELNPQRKKENDESQGDSERAPKYIPQLPGKFRPKLWLGNWPSSESVAELAGPQWLNQ